MLPLELREISGLALTTDGRLFAHGDEDATVFEIDPRSGRIRKRFGLAPTGNESELGKKGREGIVAGDFEDIAIVGNRFFLVTSTGVLLEFAEGEDGQRVPYTAHQTGLGERCEIEGLASDPAGASLLLLCKQSKVRAERDRVAIYSWSLLGQTLEPAPHIVIPYLAIIRSSGDGKFNGSALALMPGGGSLVLVAGPQRLFAEISSAGDVIGGGTLDVTSVFQPEGLAFLPDGTLLIASEGGKGPATLSGYVPRTN